ncbi:hypothetical protein JCM25156A_03090 [Komagataeibacter kakiaceti JCM 25156]
MILPDKISNIWVEFNGIDRSLNAIDWNGAQNGKAKAEGVFKRDMPCHRKLRQK